MPAFVLPVLLKVPPRTELAKLKGVQAVIGTSEFARIGQPTPQQNRRRANLCLAAGSKKKGSSSC
jgi:hypothetical protein